MKVYDMTNLWIAYNPSIDFRALVVAPCEESALDIITDYAKDSNMPDKTWLISEFNASDCMVTDFDCDYIISNDTHIESDTKEPIEEEYVYNKFGFCKTKSTRYRCPVCNNIINAGPNFQPHYCNECGTKLTFANVTYKNDEFICYVDENEV